MAKSQKNSVLTQVTAKAPGIAMAQGDLVSINETELVVRARREGSSKYEERTIARSRIRGLSDPKVGKPIVVWYTAQDAVFAHVSGQREDPSIPGFMKVNCGDDGIYHFMVDHVEASAPAEEPSDKQKPVKLLKPGQVLRVRPKRESTEKQKTSAKKNLEKAKEKAKSKSTAKKIK